MERNEEDGDGREVEINEGEEEESPISLSSIHTKSYKTSHTEISQQPERQIAYSTVYDDQ